MRITMLNGAALSLVIGALGAARGFGVPIDLRIAAALLVITLIASITTGLVVAKGRNHPPNAPTAGVYAPGGRPLLGAWLHSDRQK